MSDLLWYFIDIEVKRFERTKRYTIFIIMFLYVMNNIMIYWVARYSFLHTHQHTKANDATTFENIVVVVECDLLLDDIKEKHHKH